jgi:putative holliday junction resolvase
LRYVAIDLGDKRTGLAVGDSHTGVVSPVGVIQTPIRLGGGDALLRAIAAAIEDHLGAAPAPGAAMPAELVIGLPLNMDGSEGPRAKLVREFAGRIAACTGWPVRFQDERLTSADADWKMARSGMTHREKKNRRDALAAAVILEDFIAARRPGVTGRDPAG